DEGLDRAIRLHAKNMITQARGDGQRESGPPPDSECGCMEEMVTALRRYTLRSFAVVMAIAAPSMMPSDVGAQEYPQRTIKIIVPYPAGGTADLIPRVVFDVLSRKWGQPVVIENKPGAGGNIGAEAAFHAVPDGYTLLSSPPPPFVINHNLYRKIGYDPAAFVPVSVMGIVPNG